jgi:hypothetical protein
MSKFWRRGLNGAAANNFGLGVALLKKQTLDLKLDEFWNKDFKTSKNWTNGHLER